ncbi:MAG: tryptophan 7-halogenase, partial [Thermomicrobiaceae bacterium]|nr:tryptophan 7-halogenase [Thermomicrobiaceae bacterium]
MATRILILGGGVGGTLAANLLARQLRGRDVEITVADRTGQHVYQPGWLYIPFGRERASNLIRGERGLLHRRVSLIARPFTRIDVERRQVVADGGETLP